MTVTTDSTLTQVDNLLDALVASGVQDADLVQAFRLIQDKADVTLQSLTAPLTHSQRSTMFGLFTQVFGDSPKQARRVFTRLVLGKGSDVPVSWADNGTGTITQREASKIIDALVALDSALNP